LLGPERPDWLGSIQAHDGAVGWRVDSLLLGAVGAALFPTVYVFAYSIGAGEADKFADIGLDSLAFLGLLGLAATPFGLLGGWLFWRIGVRPAIAPPTDLAPVFD
jgi:hypothetical protein